MLPCSVVQKVQEASKGLISRLTRLPGDAGAMPRAATYLVKGKGVGRPRQRT